MADTERAYFSREQLFELLKLDNVKTVSSDAVQKAQTGDPVELYNIGREYEVSRQEFTKALGFYFLSAELNYGQASEAIGVMYQKGHGVPVQYHVALEWYLKAARESSPQYGSLIGNMFSKGLGINTDVVKAHEWFHKQGLTLSGDESRSVLTKEQKDKSIDRLISESEEILHQAVFRTITFDAYKQLKIGELNLINHIKMLQNSNSMCIKMNQKLSGRVELLVKDNNKLKSALISNSATAKKEKKALEKTNSNYKQDLGQALQRVKELQNDYAQLFNMVAAEKLAKGANEKKSQQQEIGKEKLEQERIQLNRGLEQERVQLKEELEQERTKHKDELEQERTKHKEELDKERANHKKAIDYVKEQNKTTMDALRSTNKKNMEREREIREKQVERYKDLLKKEIEKEKTQAQKLKSAHTQHKTTEQQLHQQVSDLQAQINELEQEVKDQQTENVEIKARQGDNQDTLQLLSQSYNSFEQEMGNMDALIRFMQSTRNNLNRSSMEMKAAITGAGGHVEKAVGHRSILSHSALHVQHELERESEMRRKRRREEVNGD